MPAACCCRCATSSPPSSFVFFGLQVDLDLVPDVAVAAVVIAAVTIATKVATGWIAAGRVGIGKPGRARAGAALIAHGEFSIVIAELGISRESDLGALAATYVIILTLVGAVLYQYSDSITLHTPSESYRARWQRKSRLAERLRNRRWSPIR